MLLNAFWARQKVLANTSGGVRCPVGQNSVLLRTACRCRRRCEPQPSGRALQRGAASRGLPEITLLDVIDMRPSVSMVATRHFPRVMIAHSAVWCQCNSRMPPGARCMLTPAISSEIAKSSDVSSRAHPPFWIRLGEMLKEDQKKACVLISVGSGSLRKGNWLSIASLCGPSLRRLSGLPRCLSDPRAASRDCRMLASDGSEPLGLYSSDWWLGLALVSLLRRRRLRFETAPG